MDDLSKRLKLYHIQLTQFIGLVTDIQNNINQINDLNSALLTVLSFVIAIFQLLILYQTSLLTEINFLAILTFLILITVLFYFKRRRISKEADKLKSKLNNLIDEMKNPAKNEQF